MPPAPFTLVDSTDGLRSLVENMRGHSIIALDTESDGFFRYRPKLCLLQLRYGTTNVLVDPLASIDLAPLFDLLAQPGVESVLHDAEQDVMMLRRQFGVTLGRIFDTSWAARLVGMTSIGLAGVVQHFFNVTLDKKEQRSDWARRPLTQQQLVYAALDVEHLLELRNALNAKLIEMGRLHAAEQAFERIRHRVPAERAPDVDGWRTMKGVKTLDARQRGVLKSVWEWREAAASARDMAPFRVMNPETVFELARQAPATLDALQKVRGVPPSATRGDDGKALLQALTQSPPYTGPLTPPRGPETEEERIEAARFEALRAWRSEAAKAMGVEVGVIASNNALKLIAHNRPSSPEALAALNELLPWQVDAYAAQILQVLAQPVQPAPSRRGR